MGQMSGGRDVRRVRGINILRVRHPKYRLPWTRWEGRWINPISSARRGFIGTTERGTMAGDVPIRQVVVSLSTRGKIERAFPSGILSTVNHRDPLPPYESIPPTIIPVLRADSPSLCRETN